MTDDFDILITAEQAWPALERAVLKAEHSVTAGFRIFDMDTRLRSEEGRAVGDTWFDLLAHVLGKGVRVTLSVSDFDPVMAPDLHSLSMRTVKQGEELAVAVNPKADQLRVAAHLHPAKAGMLPWLGFLPFVKKKQLEARKKIKKAGADGEPSKRLWHRMPAMNPATHHQKVAVIDDDILYIGGLDLNERRYDSTNHDRPAAETWSDIQVLLRGPEAKAAKRHLDTYRSVTEGRAAVPDCPGLKRTLSAPRRFQMPFLSPRTLLNEIEEAHVAAFKRAKKLIYIETQFLRSSVIAETLAEAGARSPDLTSVIVLPALPEDVAFDRSDSLDAKYGLSLAEDAIQTVQEAFGSRLTLAVPVQPRLADRDSFETLAGSPVIHVHNKVLVQDDAYALIGSANLNGRSMRWDTELAVEITDPSRVDRARAGLLQHWWHQPLPKEAMDPTTLQPWWAERIKRNGVSLPENRSGFLVPFDVEQHARMGQPLPGVTEDVV